MTKSTNRPMENGKSVTLEQPPNNINDSSQVFSLFPQNPNGSGMENSLMDFITSVVTNDPYYPTVQPPTSDSTIGFGRPSNPFGNSDDSCSSSASSLYQLLDETTQHNFDTLMPYVFM